MEDLEVGQMISVADVGVPQDPQRNGVGSCCIPIEELPPIFPVYCRYYH